MAGGVDHGRIVAFRQGGALFGGVVQALERAAIVAALTITKELAVAAVESKFRGDYLRDVLTGLVPVDAQVVEHCRRSAGASTSRWWWSWPNWTRCRPRQPPSPAAAGRRWSTDPSMSGSARRGRR